MAAKGEAKARAQRRAGGRYAGVAQDVRRAERRDRFIAAGTALFGRAGVAGTTTRALCAEAGLTQRYFYESFADTEALFLAVVRRLGSELQERIMGALAGAPADPLQQMRAALLAYFTGIQRDPRIGRILLVEIYAGSQQAEPMIRGFMEDLAGVLQANLRAAFPGFEPRGDELALFGTGFLGAVHHLALNWVLRDYATPVQDLVDTALRFFAAPLREVGLLAQPLPSAYRGA